MNTTSQIARVVSFVQRHPGFYVDHSDCGVTIRVEAVSRTGERWSEFCSVWSIAGAREVLGY